MNSENPYDSPRPSVGGAPPSVAFGALIGLALVAMFYWYRSRLSNHS